MADGSALVPERDPVAIAARGGRNPAVTCGTGLPGWFDQIGE